MNTIIQYWKSKPLNFILISSLTFRLLAVLFSKGFGMHDDHFLIIESSQSWADGTDYNHWLPKNGNTQASGHSWFYPGLHYYFFSGLQTIGITDAQTKMYWVRLVHALLSLLTLFWAYKIAEKRSNRETANIVGLVLGLLWFMPFMSVRNLTEVVCITPLMAGTWLLIKKWDDKTAIWYDFAIGLIIGLAFSVRFQTLFFIGGLGLALLLYKRWKQTITVGLGILVSIISLQGGIDYCIWGHPFVEMTEYIKYNIANKYNYETHAWYTYLILLAGIMVPPVSLFIYFGWLKSWRKHLILFLPTLIFFAFHSYFPNKQERFILPVVPFLIMGGIMGWQEFVNTSVYWQDRPKLLKGCWIFFWVLNLLLLPVISTMYSKKARVEAMTYLAGIDSHIRFFMQEDTNHDDVKMPTRYYLNHQWPYYYDVSNTFPWKAFRQSMRQAPIKEYPQYALFYEDKNLNNRVDSLKSVFPNVKYLTTIEPSFVDKVLYKLNPKNSNQVITIYKIEPLLNQNIKK